MDGIGLRARIDAITDQLIEKLKHRSAYSLNPRVRRVDYLDVEERIFDFYLQMLGDLDTGCIRSQKISSRLDREILGLCDERIINIGKRVAIWKLETDSSLLNVDSDEELTERLRDKNRERNVIKNALLAAERWEFYRPQFVRKFFGGLIVLTTETQLNYVRETQGVYP